MPTRAGLLWPWWVRLSHWLVAAGVVSLWLMSYVWYETDALHRTVGYGVLSLIGMRILLGVSSAMPAARLHFPGWSAICAHVRELRQGHLSAHYGHNPLGQWAVYVIWALVAGLALSGWLSRTDAYWGEDWPVSLHVACSWALLMMVVLHLTAVVLVGHWSGQRLIRQMWHGRFDTRNRR